MKCDRGSWITKWPIRFGSSLPRVLQFVHVRRIAKSLKEELLGSVIFPQELLGSLEWKSTARLGWQRLRRVFCSLR